VIPNTTTEKALAAALAGASVQATVIPVTEHGEGLRALEEGVVKDSMGGRLGLRAGDRIGIVEGQHIPVGGDILLSVQGVPMTSADDRPAVLKALEALKVGDDLRVTVFRGDKIVELTTKFTGF
jgi:S1-C subfamily serine protease